ncbi:MAG: amino acid decarboxylase [Gemmatimonadaceae bacterium]|nr:amino acid decarboxylase [Gemmatimonadaceae bacterium]
MTDATPIDQSFDPASPAEWDALHMLGERMLGEMLYRLRGLPESPAWQPMPLAVRQSLQESVPREGIGADATYAQFVERILPYPNGNWHPRFFGWVQGNGTPLAMLADMLASGLNAHLAGFNQAPADVERLVVSWFAELMGMPSASGLFVTGGTMANTHGLAVARFAAARSRGHDVRAFGLQAWPDAAPHAPLVFYGSSETHGWAGKAAEWLGLGHRAFRRVPVDAAYRMDLVALEQMLAADRAAGLDPFCVIGTAGTVNTGATDDLSAIAALCARESLWFHVDGAFGALVALSDSLRPQVAGMERADSIAFDLHKWGSMPFECACVLVRDPALHHDAFRSTAAYLTPATRGVGADAVYFADRGLDLTRGFKALKVWMQLKADGVDTLARIIEQNVAQVCLLVTLVEAHDELEMLAPAPLNIACFRYVTPGLAAGALDALNQELLLRLQERGIAVPSSTVLDGRFAIRVAHVNHRTKRTDIELLVDAVVAIGRELVAEGWSLMPKTPFRT